MLLPSSSWSILNLLDNTNSLGKVVAGGVLTLIGLITLVWGIVKILAKLMRYEFVSVSQSWPVMIGAVILGGALMVGGFSLALDIAEGGKQTVDDLGNAMILFLQVK